MESAFVLAGKGQEIPADVVAHLDLRLVNGRVVQGPEPEPEIRPLDGLVPTAEPQPEPVQASPLPVDPPITPVMAPAAPSEVPDGKPSKPKGPRR